MMSQPEALGLFSRGVNLPKSLHVNKGEKYLAFYRGLDRINIEGEKSKRHLVIEDALNSRLRAKTRFP